jgi:putative ABC transport system ATP-binding protein
MTESTQQVIKLSNISKVFQTDEVETHALSGINLEINKGEFVSIAGPSGSGKTTLLSVIGLLDTPSGGEYLLNGRSINSLNADEAAGIRNQEIGFIFQSFNLISDLTVDENIRLPLSYRGLSSAERKQRASDALERVGLSHRRNHYPAQLSGGQQQRVAVARALSGTPSILLADEPTGNLDSRNAQSIMELLIKLNEQGTTIVMVTHDPRFARSAQRTICLFDGQIARPGDPVSAAEEEFAIAR